MTDIEALRARMREAAEKANAADACSDLGAFKDAYSYFQTVAIPDAIIALDAEITRLRDDLDRVTRERDGAYLTSQQAAQSYSNLMRVKEDIDAQRQDAEAALAKRDEEVARYKRKLMQGEAILAGWTRIDRIKLAAGEMTAQEARTALAVAKAIAASVRSAIAAEPEALTKEPTNAE